MSPARRASAVLLLLACGVAAAQDSAPAPAAHPLRASMIRLQQGVWDLDATRSVVKALIDGGNAVAARWWLDLADAAVQQTKLPAKSNAALLALRREADAKVATQQDLLIARKLLRHAESAEASKNHVECERLCLLEQALLQVVPEPQVSKALATLRKTLADQPRQDGDPQNLQRQRKESAPAEEAAVAKIREALRKGVADYEVAGHRPARVTLLSAIESPIAALDAQEKEALAKRIWAAARQVELTKTLAVFMRGGQRVKIRRDGAPFILKSGADGFDSSQDDGYDFTVLEGEVIQFRPEPVTVKPTDAVEIRRWATKNCFVVGAILDGKPVGPEIWHRIAADEADKAEPALRSIPRGRKGKGSLGGMPKEMEPDELKEVKSWLTFAESSNSAFTVPFSEDLEALEASVKNRGLNPVWIGTGEKKLVIALRVPEFK